MQSKGKEGVSGTFTPSAALGARNGKFYMTVYFYNLNFSFPLKIKTAQESLIFGPIQQQIYEVKKWRFTWCQELTHTEHKFITQNAPDLSFIIEQACYEKINFGFQSFWNQTAALRAHVINFFLQQRYILKTTTTPQKSWSENLQVLYIPGYRKLGNIRF